MFVAHGMALALRGRLLQTQAMNLDYNQLPRLEKRLEPIDCVMLCHKLLSWEAFNLRENW